MTKYDRIATTMTLLYVICHVICRRDDPAAYPNVIPDPCVISGSEAAAAGLQPGQCILKVNGNSMNLSDYQEVLEHFTSSQQEHPDMVRDLALPLSA